MAGQRAFLWTILRCQERDFQQFLGVDNETAAAQCVKEVCEVRSRAELDRDPVAEARWDEQIRRRYLQYQQDQKLNHHNQEM